MTADAERRETKALQLPYAGKKKTTKKALDLCGLYADKSASIMSIRDKKTVESNSARKNTGNQIQIRLLNLYPSPSRL